MKYFRDTVGKVHGFASDGSQDGYIQEDMVELTPEEFAEFTKPSPPTQAEKISALESQVTPRNLRGAALGDQYAIDHMQSIEDQIEALRA